MMKFKNNKISDQAIVWLSKINSQHFSEQEEKQFLVWLGLSVLHSAAYLEIEALWVCANIEQKK